jgi:DNA-binding response OmpR family regulator
MEKGAIEKVSTGGPVMKFTAGKPETEHDESERRVKILVADDEQDLLDIYSRALKENGFEVYSATCGNEAVAKFIEIRPDLVILDYRMPRGNGLEAASEIIAMKPSAKIIMLTADGTVLEEAERIGVELFLVKPISLQTLTVSVRTLLSLKATSAIINR